MEHWSAIYALVARRRIHDFKLRKAQSDRLLATRKSPRTIALEQLGLGMQSRSKCRIAIVLPSIILIFLTGLLMIPAILAFQHFRENQLTAIDTEMICRKACGAVTRSGT